MANLFSLLSIDSDVGSDDDESSVCSTSVQSANIEAPDDSVEQEDCDDSSWETIAKTEAPRRARDTPYEAAYSTPDDDWVDSDDDCGDIYYAAKGMASSFGAAKKSNQHRSVMKRDAATEKRAVQKMGC